MATRASAPLTPAEAEIVAGLDPLIQPYALLHRDRLLQRSIPYVFISGRRSRDLQASLHEDPKRVSARPGKSAHEIGFAWDATGPRNAAEWEIFGQEAEALGLEWGGRYRPKPDFPHVETREKRDTLATYQYLKLAAVGLTVGLIIAVSTRSK